MKRAVLTSVILGLFACAAVADQAATVVGRGRGPVIDPGYYRAVRESGSDGCPAWVFFIDKENGQDDARPAALAAARRTLHERCLTRRAARGRKIAVVDDHDLPITDQYVRQVLDTGARLRVRSNWLNAVSVEATVEQIETIADFGFVKLIKPLARSARIDPPPAPIAGGPAPAGAAEFYGNAAAQLQQLNIPAAHAAGYTGAGVVIGILDTGFVQTHEAFNDLDHPLTVLGEWDVINDDGNVGIEAGDPPDQHRHGTLILGTIAAYKPDFLVGGAYDASFYLAKTEDTSREVPMEEDYYVAGLEWIEANGADLATSSLGYIDWYTQADLDGATAVTTRAVNIATANGLVCCTAAGNAGHDFNSATSRLVAPGDALEVITCGAVDVNNNIAGFSSDGPTADGRVKPEVLAQGISTATVDPNSNTDYTTASGTSLSTPLVAAGAALVIQAHPDWTVGQVRSALFRTASDYYFGGWFDPLFVRGYGIIDVMAAIGESFAGDLDADGVISLDDYRGMADCGGGPGVAPVGNCSQLDLDDDGDFDVLDFAPFQVNFTGDWMP